MNLNISSPECIKCIKTYKKKHLLEQGGKFELPCSGIPNDFVTAGALSVLSSTNKDAAESLLNPVAWAKEMLDWHCLDLDGSVWKRKNPNEYFSWVSKNPGKSIEGHSRYHRPYQSLMLRCTSKKKVTRIGRQAGKTESMVINMLFHLFTSPGKDAQEGEEGFVAVLVTPYQSQIDLIFKRVEELIRSSKGLSKSIKRLVKSPFYQLELYNGSILKGFTASSKSGGNAESVRGQHADMLVLDETDYLNSGDIDAVMSVVTNSPNASIIASSTPSGKRERFYGLCKSPYWKEFHYSSHANPLFDENIDRQFKDQLTSLGYKREILAEFSEEEEGVFQNAFIQAAKRDYEYGFYSYNPSWTYTIGVDWNDTANGTTINVLGLNPLQNEFVIVSRYVVSKEGWTQLSACNKIAELNRTWRPLAIYIDAGYGGVQYEILKKYGHDAMIDPAKGPNHPDSKLREVVKQYDFGSNVEVRDPFDKTIVKKPAKPFLVESTVRRFETGDIIFPESDERLEQQLGSYIISRITQTGRPVYKARTKEIGDHALDALMLSVVAFVLEATPFGKPSYENEIKFTGYFGEAKEKEQGLSFSSSERNTYKSSVSHHKPEMSRALKKEDTYLHSPSLPANNTVESKKDSNNLKLWSWSGFLRDSPMPSSKPSMFRGPSKANRPKAPSRKKSW